MCQDVLKLQTLSKLVDIDPIYLFLSVEGNCYVIILHILKIPCQVLTDVGPTEPFHLNSQQVKFKLKAFACT